MATSPEQMELMVWGGGALFFMVVVNIFLMSTAIWLYCNLQNRQTALFSATQTQKVCVLYCIVFNSYTFSLLVGSSLLPLMCILLSLYEFLFLCSFGLILFLYSPLSKKIKKNRLKILSACRFSQLLFI